MATTKSMHRAAPGASRGRGRAPPRRPAGARAELRRDAALRREASAKGELPPVAQRLPKTPLVVDLAAKGRSVGKSGGEIVTLVARGARHPLHLGPAPTRASSATPRSSTLEARHPGEASTTRTTGSSPSACATAIAGPTGIRSRPRTSATTGRTSRNNQELSPAGPARVHDRGRQAAAASRSSTSAPSATPGTSRTRASCRSSPGRATRSSTGRRTT